MSDIVVLSIAASAIGLFTIVRSHRRVLSAAGILLVCAGIAALVLSRPSRSRGEDALRNVAAICHDVGRDLERFRLHQENEAFRSEYPWSEQAYVWLGLEEVARSVEPLCLPNSDVPCLTDPTSVPGSYEEVRPELDRFLHALDTHSPCRDGSARSR